MGLGAGDLRRKYENISRAVAEDPMYFYDDIFSIEPVEGRVWAKSTFTVTVTFAPRWASKVYLVEGKVGGVVSNLKNL